MRIGIPDELMSFPFMQWLKDELTKHADIHWLHKPISTNNTIMLSEGDACLPFKSMVRTGVGLLPDIDILLVPRLVRLDSFLMCPNFRALPDIIRLNIRKTCPDFLDKLLDITVDISTEEDSKKTIQTVIKQICHTTINTKAIGSEQVHQSKSTRHGHPFGPKTIGLIGHPYLLENTKLNMGIINQLEKLGYAVTTPKDIPFTELDELAKKGDYYAKTNYWRSSRETLGAFHYYTTINRVAGLIYLISFNCGVDALMRIELMSLHGKLEQAIPFMVLVGDEHTQQEHTATRLEAYLDIIDGI